MEGDQARRSPSVVEYRNRRDRTRASAQPARAETYAHRHGISTIRKELSCKPSPSATATLVWLG